MTKKDKRELFVMETLVIESSNPNLPAGSRPNWTIFLDGSTAMVAPGNLKMLTAALVMLDIFDPRSAAAIAAVSEEKGGWNGLLETGIAENAFAGDRVHILASGGVNREMGKFTKMTFTPTKLPSAAQLALVDERKAT